MSKIPKPPRSRISAGLLMFRHRNDEIEVLLAHPGGPFYVRKDDGVWTIPKGEYGGDEDALQAAVRELTEEMGRPPPEGDPLPLGEARQRSGKINVIWALRGDFDATRIS